MALVVYHWREAFVLEVVDWLVRLDWRLAPAALRRAFLEPAGLPGRRGLPVWALLRPVPLRAAPTRLRVRRVVVPVARLRRRTPPILRVEVAVDLRAVERALVVRLRLPGPTLDGGW